LNEVAAGGAQSSQHRPHRSGSGVVAALPQTLCCGRLEYQNAAASMKVCLEAAGQHLPMSGRSGMGRKRHANTIGPTAALSAQRTLAKVAANGSIEPKVTDAARRLNWSKAAKADMIECENGPLWSSSETQFQKGGYHQP